MHSLCTIVLFEKNKSIVSLHPGFLPKSSNALQAELLFKEHIDHVAILLIAFYTICWVFHLSQTVKLTVNGTSPKTFSCSLHFGWVRTFLLSPPTAWHFELTLQSNDPRCQSTVTLPFWFCPSHSLREGTINGLAITSLIEANSMPAMSVPMDDCRKRFKTF